MQDFLSAIPNPPIIGTFMSALQELPAMGSDGSSAGGLFDNLKLSLLAGYAMAQNARLPVFTGAEIGEYESGVDGLDAACANIDSNVQAASQYVLGVVTTAFLNDLQLPESSSTSSADTDQQKSWLEALSGLSVCAAINPCENTYIMGFDVSGASSAGRGVPVSSFCTLRVSHAPGEVLSKRNLFSTPLLARTQPCRIAPFPRTCPYLPSPLQGFSTPPINTEVGQLTFSLLRAGFSYGSNFNTSFMDLVVHNAWSYDWSK